MLKKIVDTILNSSNLGRILISRGRFLFPVHPSVCVSCVCDTGVKLRMQNNRGGWRSRSRPVHYTSVTETGVETRPLIDFPINALRVGNARSLRDVPHVNVNFVTLKSSPSALVLGRFELWTPIRVIKTMSNGRSFDNRTNRKYADASESVRI